MTTRRRLVRAACSVLGALLFGRAMASIPAPHDVGTFWVGNLSSPWAVIAFAAGFAQRRYRWGAAAGAVSLIACVVGFYSQGLAFDGRWLDEPAAAARMTELELVVEGASHWLASVKFWILVATVAGAAYGLIGARHALRPGWLTAIALGAPFLVEPVMWPLYDGFVRHPVLLWVTEPIVGLVVIGVLAVTLRRRAKRDQYLRHEMA